MQAIQKTVIRTIIITEISHIFCCVLPTIFAVFTLLTSIGAVSTIPGFITSLHEIMHDWELPILFTSFAVLVIGWGLQIYSARVNCSDTGCHHEPCDTKKVRTKTILQIATLLLCFNVFVYFTFHNGYQSTTEDAISYQNDIHKHDGHSHKH